MTTVVKAQHRGKVSTRYETAGGNRSASVESATGSTTILEAVVGAGPTDPSSPATGAGQRGMRRSRNRQTIASDQGLG